MKTYNQFLETPFSEEVKPPEPPSEEEDPGIKSKQKRQMQIKKMVLLKKLQAVRAGSGADIVASHTPEGDVLDERNKIDDANRKWLEKRQKKIEQKHKEGKPVKPMQDYGEEVVHEGDVHSGQGEKIQKRTKAWMDKKGQKGAPGLDAMKARTAEHKAKRGVKEGTDKAFEYVKKQIAAKYGKSGYVSKDNPRKPQTDADKAKARAHQAKVDAENAAERAKDPSQGRYPKG